MYDACDEGEAARAPLGPLRKRLDSRRNTKPKKAAAQLQVWLDWLHWALSS